MKMFVKRQNLKADLLIRVLVGSYVSRIKQKINVIELTKTTVGRRLPNTTYVFEIKGYNEKNA